MSDDHIEHFEASLRNSRRIDRAKEIREEQRCSLQEAVAFERQEYEGDAATVSRYASELKAARAVLEQAQCCILGDTPEGMTHEEARKDTLSKIRDVLLFGEEKYEKVLAREQHAQSVLAAIRKVRDGYADQAKFADIEAAVYFREFVRRLDEAVSPKSTNPPWGGRSSPAITNTERTEPHQDS